MYHTRRAPLLFTTAAFTSENIRPAHEAGLFATLLTMCIVFFIQLFVSALLEGRAKSKQAKSGGCC
jgi:hypothetical protein